MADISAIGGNNPVEPLDFSDYADNKEYTPLPKAGRYTVKAPDAFPSSAFGRTKAGALSIQVDPVIVGPTNEGYTIRFTKVSAKTFKRGASTVSQLGDYLRANGFRGRLADEQSQADAVEATANQVYEVETEWRAYNKDTGFSIEGMNRFPSDGNGGHLPWVEDPQAKDDQGNPVRLRANLIVSRYVPATV
jgi:hypothetical protein